MSRYRFETYSGENVSIRFGVYRNVKLTKVGQPFIRAYLVQLIVLLRHRKYWYIILEILNSGYDVD